MATLVVRIGAEGQSAVAVGVERGVYVEMFALHALDREISEGEPDGRVGLERHPDVQSVDVESSDFPFFVCLVGLLVNNGAYCHDLHRGQAEFFGLGGALLVPHSLVVVAHLLYYVGGDADQ